MQGTANARLSAGQALPGAPGSAHAPQQHTEGVDICGLGQLSLHEQLRRHVCHRAESLQPRHMVPQWAGAGSTQRLSEP